MVDFVSDLVDVIVSVPVGDAEGDEVVDLERDPEDVALGESVPDAELVYEGLTRGDAVPERERDGDAV